jgi:hypothetical protein
VVEFTDENDKANLKDNKDAMVAFGVYDYIGILKGDKSPIYLVHEDNGELPTFIIKEWEGEIRGWIGTVKIVVIKL